MSVISTATVSSLSIATDLGLHIWNYGVPFSHSTAWNSGEALAIAGTTSGVLTTAITSGVTSGTLSSVVSAETSAYERTLTRVAINNSVIPTKIITQVVVTSAYRMLNGVDPVAFSEWSSKVWMPSLLIHCLLAGIIPYTT